ncbi:hypothetical protein RF11_06000 [Thelohanellus kitauei]|uniref:Uncharacterized protein n=1 Tax=Thelohanellus kitauei TaxID=669202 RepID=A0A0C2N2Q5_THEKT|nr:hypothetical protein RF11_06000 [Thelohanellus kitauei]
MSLLSVGSCDLLGKSQAVVSVVHICESPVWVLSIDILLGSGMRIALQHMLYCLESVKSLTYHHVPVGFSSLLWSPVGRFPFCPVGNCLLQSTQTTSSSCSCKSQDSMLG